MYLNAKSHCRLNFFHVFVPFLASDIVSNLFVTSENVCLQIFCQFAPYIQWTLLAMWVPAGFSTQYDFGVFFHRAKHVIRLKIEAPINFSLLLCNFVVFIVKSCIILIEIHARVFIFVRLAARLVRLHIWTWRSFIEASWRTRLGHLLNR